MSYIQDRVRLEEMDILGKMRCSQRESGSGVVRRETPIIYRWEAVRSVHRRGGGGCRDRDDARLRQLDTSKFDGVMMVPARRAGLEGAVFDAEDTLGYVALEADSDRPTPEAREAAVLGRWEATELPRALLHQLEGACRLRTPSAR